MRTKFTLGLLRKRLVGGFYTNESNAKRGVTRSIMAPWTKTRAYDLITTHFHSVDIEDSSPAPMAAPVAPPVASPKVMETYNPKESQFLNLIIVDLGIKRATELLESVRSIARSMVS